MRKYATDKQRLSNTAKVHANGMTFRL